MEEGVLNTGTFYWFKSQRRGKVAVPLHYLTDEQKKTLRLGLTSNKYEQCNPRIISPRKLISEKPSYRITLSEMKRLLNELKCGEVDEIYVEKILSNISWKPWVEKEWKSKRDLIIKDYCESCEIKEKLVLQHTIQPRKVNSILYGLVGERYEEFRLFAESNKNNIELSFSEDIKKIPVCPKCDSSQVHLRIRGINKGTYVCNKTRNYVVCKHKFVKPDYGYSEIDIKRAEKRREALLRDKFCKKEGLLRIAVEKSLEEIIIYLNFDHTKTLCSRCAYIEDRPFDKYY